jgi:hypothetical protein
MTRQDVTNRCREYRVTGQYVFNFVLLKDGRWQETRGVLSDDEDGFMLRDTQLLVQTTRGYVPCYERYDSFERALEAADHFMRDFEE